MEKRGQPTSPIDDKQLTRSYSHHTMTLMGPWYEDSNFQYVAHITCNMWLKRFSGVQFCLTKTLIFCYVHGIFGRAENEKFSLHWSALHYPELWWWFSRSFLMKSPECTDEKKLFVLDSNLRTFPEVKFTFHFFHCSLFLYSTCSSQIFL